MINKVYIFTALLACTLALAKNNFINKSVQHRQPSVSSMKAYPGGFEVYIVSNIATPIEANQEFKLTAQISMQNGEGAFEFMWWLPEGVEVIRGQVDPSLAFNQNGQASTEIVLLIKDKSKNYQIDGEAYRIYENGFVHGSIKQFNTHPHLLESSTVKPVLKKHRISQ